MRNRGYRRWDGSSQWSPKSINGNVLWLRSDLGITLNPIAPQIPLAFEGCALANCTVPITNGADPFGGTQARKVLDNGVNGLHFAGQVATRSWNIGTNLTESVYAKAAELTWCWIGNTNHTAYINLSTGAVGTLVGGCTATTQSMGNGWWKITLSKTPTTVSDSALYLGLATSDGVSSYAGSSQGVFFYLADISAPQVSAWADQSGSNDSNKNAVQAAAANQPPYLVSDTNFAGKPSLSFISASSYKMATGLWASSVAQPWTVFVVGSDDGAAAPQVYFEGGNDLIGTNRTLVYQNATNYELNAGVALTDGARGGNSRVLGGIFNGVSSKIYNNAKTAAASGDSGAKGPLGVGFIGTTYTNTAFLNGKLLEIVVYNRAVADAELVPLWQYFGSRYNISIGA